ncbi:MAG: hypothetical protein PHO41_11585, partial [Eubacteriales bacterium]|nr:hypothetical protein [Eubacteriales bacterium]
MNMAKKLVAVLLSLAMVFTLTAGFAADESTTETLTDKVAATGTVYKIALSNSYMGNDWRQQMERIAEYVASTEPYASRCELTIYNCSNDAQSQSDSIDAIVAQGYDAILIDAASAPGSTKRSNAHRPPACW